MVFKWQNPIKTKNNKCKSTPMLVIKVKNTFLRSILHACASVFVRKCSFLCMYMGSSLISALLSRSQWKLWVM